MLKNIISLFSIFFFTNISFSNSTMWFEQNSGTTQTLTSIYSTYMNNVWVCGYGGTVLRTTNVGANWINVSGNGIPTNMQLISIASISSNIAVTAGYVGTNTFVFRTSNAGVNWSQVFTQSNGFINALHFRLNSDEGFMIGDPVGGRWSMWKTTNGGISWDSSRLFLSQTGTEAGWVNSLYVKGTSDKMWFGTNNSKVYYSANFGTNWVAQSTIPEVNSYAIWFCHIFDVPVGFIGGTSLMRTTNNGTEWNNQTSIGSGNFGGISGGPNLVFNSSAGYQYQCYVRSDNKIYFSHNFDSSWAVEYIAPNGNYRYVASDPDGLNFWAVRDNGGISYLDLPVGIQTLSSEIPMDYSLEQNYPNPFNPVTNINYQLPSSGKVILKIFDVNGREVETLVDDFQTAGHYNVTFDSKNISSGVYFYRLTTGNYSATKRMILLK